MFEWSEEHATVRQFIRQFIEKEIVPLKDELEHGDLPPYDVLRKLLATFGMDTAARASFAKRIAVEKAVAAAIAAGEEPPVRNPSVADRDASLTMIPIIELCRHCPGMVTAMGVSMGLTVVGDLGQGHDRAEGALGPRAAHDGEDRRVGHHRAQLGLRRVRLDAGDRPPRRRRVRAQRLEDLHHQRPLRRHDRVHLQARRGQRRPADRKVLSFVLDKGMPGLEQSKPLRKMGMHSSPTGELFLDDVRVGIDRLIGETEEVRPAAATAPRPRSRWSARASPPWRSASSSSASSSRSSTPRTACSSASPSATSSSSRTSSPAWRSPASTCRTWCSATSRWPAGRRRSPSPRPRP